VEPATRREFLEFCQARTLTQAAAANGPTSVGPMALSAGPTARDGDGRRPQEGVGVMLFADRADAGRRLARRLEHLRGRDVVVLGLPRGGVPVAYEIARALDAPLDVIVVRKLGVPFQPELAMGAIGEDGVRVMNPAVLRSVRIDPGELAAVEKDETAELERRLARLRRGRPRVPVAGRTAVIVDDGLATGSTARAACQVARGHGAARIVLAVPVAPAGTVRAMADVADEVICLHTPAEFWSIGQWYADFTPTSDRTVIDLLDRAQATTAQAADPTGFDAEVVVAAGPVDLPGRLTVPAGAAGLVVFAHGSGSSRRSPRNRYVADVLAAAGLGTLLFDLLTPAEERDRGNVFDIELLAGRLRDAIGWLRGQPAAAHLRIGLFGASTGAGAALWAAAEADADVAAVVSRGGRPDLAAARLSRVTAPTLLIVGGRDQDVLRLNRAAASMLRCEHRVAVVPGATHLFEEPGTLRAAAELARDWFTDHLRQ
jgi:putative phosphoribosyl transferase